MDLSKKLSTDIVFATLMTFASSFQGIIFIPLITSMLGIRAYGAFTQLIIVASLLATMFEFRLHASLIRFSQEETTPVSELYYALVGTAIVGGISAALILFHYSAAVAELVLGSSDFTDVFKIGAILVPIKIVESMASNYFRSVMRTKTFSFLKGIYNYVSVIAIAFALVVFGVDLNGVVLTLVVVEGVYVVILQTIVTWHIGVTIPSLGDIPRSLRYSLPLVGAQATKKVVSRIDRLLIGFFLGSTAVGIYNAIYSVSSIISMYVAPITDTFFPEFSRLLEENRYDDVRGYLGSGVRYFLLIAVPSVAGLSVIGPSLVRLLAGQQTAPISQSILPIIAIGLLFHGLDEIYSSTLIANKQTISVSIIEIIASILNILLNMWLIPQIGLMGAAIVTLLTYTVTAGGHYTIIWKSGIAVFNLGTVVRVTGAATVMYIALTMFFDQYILIPIIVGPIIYFGVLYAVGELDDTDIDAISDFIS